MGGCTHSHHITLTWDTAWPHLWSDSTAEWAGDHTDCPLSVHLPSALTPCSWVCHHLHRPSLLRPRAFQISDAHFLL